MRLGGHAWAPTGARMIFESRPQPTDPQSPRELAARSAFSIGLSRLRDRSLTQSEGANETVDVGPSHIQPLRNLVHIPVRPLECLTQEGCLEAPRCFLECHRLATSVGPR